MYPLNPNCAELMSQVLSIDTEKKTVHTSKDNTFHYDILVLATGSAAGLPPYVSAAQAKDTKGRLPAINTAFV
jgi:NAD(P)H-nitrite reductase large subunit